MIIKQLAIDISWGTHPPTLPMSSRMHHFPNRRPLEGLCFAVRIMFMLSETSPTKRLDQASAAHSDDLIETKVDPLLKRLHQDPPYPALLKKLNLPN
jgi:hypothetical protein